MNRYSIVFDNQCAVCNIGAMSFKRLGLMDEKQVIKLDSFNENAAACNVDPLRACDEMAVIDNETFEVSYGYEGWAKVISQRSKTISKLMRFGIVKSIGNPIYIFFASNRRIIAPMQANDNTCKPKLKKGYRFSFLLLMAVYAGFITYLKGELLSGYEGFEFINGWKLISVTGLGWLITGVTYQKEDKWDYWGHLGMMAGSAIFLQTIGLVGFYFSPSILWILVSMGLSDLLMLKMHYKRIKLMGRSQKQTLAWWIILHLSASALTLLYFI